MNGRTAIITGASRGLGYEFSKILAKEKTNLVLVSRSENRLFEIKEELENKYGIQVHVCALDLSVVDAAKQVYAFTERLNLQIDILINNAGYGDSCSFASCDWDRQYRMIQLNNIALMQMTYYYLPSMIEQGYGKILNVASVAAFSAGPYMACYFASKAFVMSFSEAISEETKGTGVTVTALCPGPTHTGFQKAANLPEDARMFRKADNAKDVAQAGIDAMEKGKALCYYGLFTKVRGVLRYLFPRYITRKYAKLLTR